MRDSAIYCPKLWKNPSEIHGRCSRVTVLACRYIIAAPLEKLYGFTVNEEILDELERLLRAYLHRYVEKKMKNHYKFLEMMK